MNSQARSRGLSLLELLVVLSLVSMVTSILFQGYGYMLASYQRIQQRQTVELKRALANAWFRDTLESLVAYSDKQQRFSATASTITGTSFSPLLSRTGIPTTIRWELRRTGDGVQLLYREDGSGREEPLLITTWPAGTTANFRYRTAEGQWQAQWVIGQDGEIPAAIQLYTGESDGEEIPPVTVVSQTRLQQYISLEEIRFGRDD